MRHLKLGLMLLCILTLCACSTKRRGDPVCALPPLALMQPGEPFVPFAEGSLTDGRIHHRYRHVHQEEERLESRRIPRAAQLRLCGCAAGRFQRDTL